MLGTLELESWSILKLTFKNIRICLNPSDCQGPHHPIFFLSNSLRHSLPSLWKHPRLPLWILIQLLHSTVEENRLQREETTCLRGSHSGKSTISCSLDTLLSLLDTDFVLQPKSTSITKEKWRICYSPSALEKELFADGNNFLSVIRVHAGRTLTQMQTPSLAHLKVTTDCGEAEDTVQNRNLLS